MIEGERQRQSQPENTVDHLDKRTVFRPVE
jgi:hypothetical protein